MIAEFIMHSVGWSHVWYAHPGPARLRNRWHVGVWTGPQNDLLCVRECKTNLEAEHLLSPGRSSILGATLAALMVRWIR